MKPAFNVLFRFGGVGVGRGCWELLSNVCLQRLSGWGNRAGRRSWPSRRLRAVGIHTGLATKMSLWSVLAAFLGIIQMYFHWHTHTHTCHYKKRMTQGGWWSCTEKCENLLSGVGGVNSFMLFLLPCMDKPNLTERISVPRKQATSALWCPWLQENYKMVGQSKNK